MGAELLLGHDSPLMALTFSSAASSSSSCSESFLPSSLVMSRMDCPFRALSDSMTVIRVLSGMALS